MLLTSHWEVKQFNLLLLGRNSMEALTMMELKTILSQKEMKNANILGLSG